MSATSVLAGTDKVDEKVASLKEKISGAYDAITGGETEVVEEEKEEKPSKKAPEVEEDSTDDEDEEEESEEEPEEGDGLSDEEIKESRKLYKALKDPASAKAVTTALAQQYGMTVGVPETKAEVKEAKKTIQEKVRAALGPEYAFLSEKIGNALESSLEDLREENESVRVELQQKEVVRETNEALEKLNRVTKGESKKLEGKISALMINFPPSGKIGAFEYLEGIYKMASADISKQKAKSEVRDKINKNAKDVSSRLAGKGVGGSETISDVPVPKTKGVKAAVLAAMESIAKDDKKK